MFDFALLIPILALSIPLVAVVGRVIVHPLASALMRLAEQQNGQRPGTEIHAHVAELEQRLARLEAPLQTLLEEHEFRKQLERSTIDEPPHPAASARA